MEWTARSVSAALIAVTAVINFGIVYWLFRDDTLLLAVGLVVIGVGSLGGYLSLSKSLAEEDGLDL